MPQATSILIVGCGKIGTAFLHALRAKRDDDTLLVVDPTSPTPEQKKLVNAWVATPSQIPFSFQPELILIAVQPTDVPTVLPCYAPFKKSIFLSLAAGITLGKLNYYLGSKIDYSIIRAVPNLPASIGQGISVAVANHHVTLHQRATCDKVLSAGGEVVWVEKESLIGPATALSGSGPTYVFSLVESMAAAGEKLGIPPEMALKLAQQTVIGSAALLSQSTQSLLALRQEVTCPTSEADSSVSVFVAKDNVLPMIGKTMMGHA